MFFSRKKSKKAPEFEPAPDVSLLIKQLASNEEFSYVDAENVHCIRSHHSQARAYARIWGLSRIFQVAAGWKPTYVIEVLAHHYDKLPDKEKIKVLIHELLHIPKTFSGALRPHNGRYHKINKTSVDKLYKQMLGMGVFVIMGIGVLFGGMMGFPGGAGEVRAQDTALAQETTFAQEIETLGEHIKEYNIGIEILTSGKIKVVEAIKYDFGLDDRHGIIREIPYQKTNDDGKKFGMQIAVEAVTDQLGRSYTYQVYREGSNEVVKIGDADKTIQGEHTYVISYEVSGALTYFSDHDELYWNAIGTGWGVPIQQAQAHVKMPDGVSEDAIGDTRCFAGYEGVTDESRCSINKNNTDVIFSINEVMEPGEGMTIVVGWPKGIVAELNPVPIVGFFDTFFGKLVLIAIVIIVVWWYLFLPLSIAYKWYKQGRDPYVGIAPTAYFDAPKTESGREIGPSEAGALIDEKADLRDVMAMLVDLARRGHFIIDERAKNELWLVRKESKVGKADTVKDELSATEAELISGLFSSENADEVKVKDLKLASEVMKIQDMMYDQLVDNGFFLKNPRTTRLIYQGLAALSFVTANIPLLFSSLVFGQHMPRKTLLGAQEAQKAKGLFSFLKSQERQITFQADKQLMFEKLLPYAVAFGVEKIWIDRFKDIAIHKPDWYQTYRGASWNSGAFSQSLNSSMNQVTASATPTRSSSGFSSGSSGGSSGGGGGGGGGGSW